MRLSMFGVLILFFCMPVALYGTGACTNHLSTLVSVPIASSGTLLFNRADVAFARSLINQTHLKGNLGESLAEQKFLPMILQEGNGWHSVTPRIGSQGIDHLFVQTTKDGLPRNILIAESKYGHSKLGHTKSGIQMGSEWTRKRLTALGDRYHRIAKSSVECAKMPLLTKQKLVVFLPNGNKQFFWRSNSQSAWMFSGEAKDLRVAQSRAEVFSKYFTAAGKGVISYRSRIFHIEPKGEDIAISILNADGLQSADMKLLPKEKLITISGGMNKKITSASIDGLASELSKKMGISPSEALQCAKEISKKSNTYAMLYRKSSYFRDSLHTSVKGSMIAGLIDVTVQLVSNGYVDFNQTGVSMGVSGMTIATARGVQYWMMKGQGKNIRFLTKSAKCSAPKLARGIAPGLSILGGIAYDGVMFFMNDNQTVEELVLNTGITIASGVAGAAASAGLLAIATTWGTASTGAAISGLSGAAATNAGLAWLGGGTVAAGGGGMAAGTVVVCVGGFVVAAVVCAAAYGVVAYVEKRGEDIYKKELFDFYGKPENLQRAVENYMGLGNGKP